jgi:hypothetical protein
MLEAADRDSGLCWIPSGACLVGSHQSCRTTRHTPSGWLRFGVGQRVAAAQRRWLNLRKSPIARFNLAGNRHAIVCSPEPARAKA